MSAADVIQAHRDAGEFFEADGVRSFVRREGEGESVVCFHGVPASSFLYRKVLPELAARDLEGIAFDLPGLGLADRPESFDYSWTGLGRFATAAVEALGLERFHMVVHDIGGPVGFEVASALPHRVASLTILNTLIEVDQFRKPWTMRPFGMRGIDRFWLSSMSKPLFRALMFRQGIGDRTMIRRDELDAYLDLLKREDGGRAFLKIMKGFETTREKRDLYAKVVRDVPYPVQVVWGRDDPALRVDTYGETARRAAGLDSIATLPGKHFFQEDQPSAIAEKVADLVDAARS